MYAAGRRSEQGIGNGGGGWSGAFSHGSGEGRCRAFSHGYKGWALRANVAGRMDS